MSEIKKELIKYEEYFNSEEFEKEYTYGGKLGNFYTEDKTVFRVWNPVAKSVKLKIYNSDGYIVKDDLIMEVYMNKGVEGVWEVIIEKDLKDKYYTFEYCFDNLVKQKKNKFVDSVNYVYTEKSCQVLLEVADMYGRASGTNGKRTMIK